MKRQAPDASGRASRPPRRRCRLAIVLASLLLAAWEPNEPSWADAPSKDIEPVTAARLASGHWIEPAGNHLAFYGRPIDLALSTDGHLLFVKDWKSLRVVDCATFELLQTINSPGGASLHGLAVSADGNIYFTNAGKAIDVYRPDAEGVYAMHRSIELPEDSFPCGIALSADESTAFVCLSKRNSVAIVDLATDDVLVEVPTGIAPFDVIVDAAGKRLFVSNLGGRRPLAGEDTAPSAGTPAVVDERGIASTGTVSLINLDSRRVERTIPVGLHPSSLLQQSSAVIVCNANDDSISEINGNGLSVTTRLVKPDERLPFGSMPNALAASPDGSLLFVALAGNNAIAVLDTKSWEMTGCLPTAWFPSGLACNETHLFVANTKGYGARSDRRDPSKGRNSHDHLGSLQKINMQQIRDAARLRQWTDAVQDYSRVKQVLESNEEELRSLDRPLPVPVPSRLGEPSVFKHVIYVIKENRTFDQLFGDIEEAWSDPKLCVFPERFTPNHHALAQRFGILDNYYCNGVLSADGHSWATEGNVTPYLERAFGGFARSYTFGDDPLTYSSSGFLWDRVLGAGLSFRNYGEMDYAQPPPGMAYQEIWKAYQAGEQLPFSQNIGIAKLRRYSCRDYPGWNMSIPDCLRIDRFLSEFREFERKGGFPNLCIVYLPQDHFGGGVTSRAHMADNDLAVGRLVEAVSTSRYWHDTVIFVNEDDPQSGYDHVDGHRSICLVVSPYSRKGVNHHFCNQTSVLRTMLHILGLPPLNQQDASAPLMAHCFDHEPRNEAPFQAIPANFPLNETPPPKSQQSSLERYWRSKLATVPVERTGQKTSVDEDNLNRFVWHEVKGWETRYPIEWAGPHGKGLNDIGLVRSGPDNAELRDDESRGLRARDGRVD